MIEDNGLLSEREIDILRLVATGASNKEIATALSISPNTVKVHLRNIFGKIQVVSRTEATLYAIRNQLVDSPGRFPNDNSEPIDSIYTASPMATTYELDQPKPPQKKKEVIFPFWASILILSALLITGMLVGARILAYRIPPTPEANSGIETSRSRWTLFTPFSHPRSFISTVSYAGSIYLIGGRDQQNTYRSNSRFLTENKVWEELTEKPTAISDTQAVVIQEEIFIPGGRTADGNASDRLEIYSISTNSWRTGKPIPEALFGSAVAAVDGSLYLFGGTDGEAYSDRVYVYDPPNDSWHEASRLPIESRAYLSTAVIEGRIYLFGGENQSGPTDNVLIYIPSREGSAGGPYETGPSMPKPLTRSSAVAMSSLVYVVGGLDDEGNSLGMNALDTQSGRWMTVESPSQQIGEAAAAVPTGNFIHIFGGRLNGKDNAEHQAYQAIYTISIPLTSN